MRWQEVGTYLERIVRVASLRTAAEFPNDLSLGGSLLMLCFEKEVPHDSETLRLFRRVASALPLAIKVYGPEASALFGRLVEHLDTERPLLHIMTGECYGRDVREALEDFLRATWPSEERFDDWRSYAIVAVGDLEFCNRVTEAARTLVSGG